MVPFGRGRGRATETDAPAGTGTGEAPRRRSELAGERPHKRPCGGARRLGAADGGRSIVDPWLLFVAFNANVVKKQIRAKQFTQDIIDTIGQRVYELELPFPRDSKLRTALADGAKRIIETRAILRDDGGLLPALLQGDNEVRDAKVARRRLAALQSRHEEVLRRGERPKG